MPKNIFLFLLISIFIIIFSEEQDEAKKSEKSEKETEEAPYDYYDDEEDYKKLLNSYNYTNIEYYDDTNYTLIFNKTDPTFILFYTPTCHYCYKFIPIFIETADYCKENKMEANFIRIDSFASPNATEEFEAMEYPSILEYQSHYLIY